MMDKQKATVAVMDNVPEAQEPERTSLRNPRDHTFMLPSMFYCALCGMDEEAHLPTVSTSGEEESVERSYRCTEPAAPAGEPDCGAWDAHGPCILEPGHAGLHVAPQPAGDTMEPGEYQAAFETDVRANPAKHLMGVEQALQSQGVLTHGMRVVFRIAREALTLPAASVGDFGPCVEKDDEGRPYQCGAFVAGDSRWECILESDHAGDHEWRIQHHTAPRSAWDVEALVEHMRMLTTKDELWAFVTAKPDPLEAIAAALRTSGTNEDVVAGLRALRTRTPQEQYNTGYVAGLRAGTPNVVCPGCGHSLAARWLTQDDVEGRP